MKASIFIYFAIAAVILGAYVAFGPPSRPGFHWRFWAAKSAGIPQPPPRPTDTTTLNLPDGSLSRPGANPGDRAELTLPGGLKMAFRWCPAGSFTMGSPPSEADRSNNENQVQVRLTRGFWMAETEVTQAQWRAVMATSVGQQRDKADASWPLRGESDDYPMYYVSWGEAADFCRKISSSLGVTLALPTEAQWEYACRANANPPTPFHFGSTITPEQANYDGNYPYGNAAKGLYREKTTAVGSFPSNAWGLRDMHGNVWEWCADWYGGSLPGGTDPTGPTSGSPRVSRGGGWFYNAQYCRSAYRSDDDPACRYGDLGFRPVLLVQ